MPTHRMCRQVHRRDDTRSGGNAPLRESIRYTRNRKSKLTMTALRREIFLLAPEELKTGNVLLELATGVGKTKLGLDLAEDYGATNVVVLVPTNKVGEVWMAEVKKWDSKLSVLTVNYASAHKVLEMMFMPHIILLDEGHHITERNLEYIRQYKCPLIAL